MRKLSLLLAAILLLCGCGERTVAEPSDASEAVSETEETTSSVWAYDTYTPYEYTLPPVSDTTETSEAPETSATPDNTYDIIDEKNMAKIEAIAKLHENQPEGEYYVNGKYYYDRLTAMKEEVKWQLNYTNELGLSYLKDLDYDFKGDEIMDEIIEILLNRDKVCSRLYIYYYSLMILADEPCNPGIDGGHPIIHYLFDSYDELKAFVEGTYTSEEADILLYHYSDYVDSPYYDYNGFLMCDSFFMGCIYDSWCYDDDGVYKITSVTDDTCEFNAYQKWYYDAENFDNYVIFEIPYTAVKENGEWRLTEMIAPFARFVENEDSIYYEYITGEKDFVPFETYRVPR